MMRGGTLLILGHGVKAQGQIRLSVYKTLWTRYRLVFAQSLSNSTLVTDDEKRNPIDFGLGGQRSTLALGV